MNHTFEYLSSLFNLVVALTTTILILRQKKISQRDVVTIIGFGVILIFNGILLWQTITNGA